MEPTVIVAGLTRSGLSVTMQMLHAGGFPCLGTPPAFEDYPIGSIPWESCRGMAVKLVDSHHQFPPDGNYRVIRLRRDLQQQARSINKWVGAICRIPALPISQLIGSLRRDYALIDEWANGRDVLTIAFEDIIRQPLAVAESLEAWLGKPLDVAAMASVVVPRGTECFSGLLELKLMEGTA